MYYPFYFIIFQEKPLELGRTSGEEFNTKEGNKVTSMKVITNSENTFLKKRMLTNQHSFYVNIEKNSLFCFFSYHKLN